jgi:hypothetical protein
VEETGEEETGQPELSDFSPRRKAPPRQMRLTQANCRRLRSWPEQRNNRSVQEPVGDRSITKYLTVRSESVL